MSIPGISFLQHFVQTTPRRSEKISEDAARQTVRLGLPARAIDDLAKLYGTSKEEIQKLVGLSKATAARARAKRSQPLKPIVSDRVARLFRVYAIARDVFEDDNKTAGWFKDRNRAMRGERPLDLLDTDIGVVQVLRILWRIEHGVYS